jgi:hypothetical protein
MVGLNRVPPGGLVPGSKKYECSRCHGPVYFSPASQEIIDCAAKNAQN